MVTLLLRLLRLLPLLCGAHRHVAQENLALRYQLAVYKKRVPRPKVRRSDRLFWVVLSRVWAVPHRRGDRLVRPRRGEAVYLHLDPESCVAVPPEAIAEVLQQPSIDSFAREEPG